MWNFRSEVFLLSLCSFCPLNSWLRPVLTHKNVREPKGLRHVRSKLLTVTFIDSLDLGPSIIPFFLGGFTWASITCLFWGGAVNISGPHPSQIGNRPPIPLEHKSGKITTVSTCFNGGSRAPFRERAAERPVGVTKFKGFPQKINTTMIFTCFSWRTLLRITIQTKLRLKTLWNFGCYD